MWSSRPLADFPQGARAEDGQEPLHICLRPVDRSRDQEVERLLALGATMATDLRDGDTGWAVLADPEGNEFCVLATRADEAGIAQR